MIQRGQAGEFGQSNGEDCKVESKGISERSPLPCWTDEGSSTGEERKDDLRGSEPAFPPGPFALDALWFFRITLDLFFSAGRTRNRKALTRSAGLCDPPLGVHGLPVDDFGYDGTIFVNPTGPLARDVFFPQDPRKGLDGRGVSLSF